MMISKMKIHLYLGAFFLILLAVVMVAWSPIWIIATVTAYYTLSHVLTNHLYSDREFKINAPEYVLAALLKLAKATEGHETLIHNKGTPFMNHGGDRKTSAFHVQAYCWDDNLYQLYNFKWRGFKVLWYKHCQRSTTMSRPISEGECASMLAECLKSLEVK